ncbi:unnamed protein product [Kuraishia capsulata CBS 1993]|uniref:HIG1 domain-containing protein n=1 Tax=Kuraishia capsulata CBS 1993 TaxID=1382522 RepID=W6MU45_9ASCO|nr:uncharacterized protein KUCA_T00001395001 [Kuraishia capsulata CBS 1993]CDK25425.1 unnamed protein product [Kuraishia capsulata CBS 1993]
MKLLTEEEVKAHNTATLHGGIKGAIAGTIVSIGIYAIAPKKYPRLFQLPWSIRTAVAIIPPTLATSIWAEESSSAFDKKMYSSDYTQQKTLEEYSRWHGLSTSDKAVEVLSEHKYKIITALWAASMWGSWVFVNKDKIMTTTQKIVQARMYAQFITVGLLLGTVALSMYEENHNLKKVGVEDDDWKQILKEEQQKQAVRAAHKRTAHEKALAAEKEKL